MLVNTHTYHLYLNTLGVSAFLSPESHFDTVTKTAFYHPQTIAATPPSSQQDMETLVHVFIALKTGLLHGFIGWISCLIKKNESRGEVP